MGLIVLIVPMERLIPLCCTRQGLRQVRWGQERERNNRRILISYAPTQEDWYHDWYEDLNWDVPTVGFEATAMAIEMKTSTSSLGLQCTISPYLVGFSMGPVPQTHYCYVDISTRTTITLKPCNQTLIWTTAKSVSPSKSLETTTAVSDIVSPPPPWEQ